MQTARGHHGGHVLKSVFCSCLCVDHQPSCVSESSSCKTLSRLVDVLHTVSKSNMSTTTHLARLFPRTCDLLLCLLDPRAQTSAQSTAFKSRASLAHDCRINLLLDRLPEFQYLRFILKYVKYVTASSILSVFQVVSWCLFFLWKACGQKRHYVLDRGRDSQWI